MGQSDKLKILKDKKDDYFGVWNKLNAIENILTPDIINCHNSIALYGNWGSGKSSVISTLKYRFDNKKKDTQIIAIKFDAWKYEKEGNLSYALLEYIIGKLENNDDKVIKYNIKAIKDEILKTGSIVLKSVGVNYAFFNISFENNKKADVKYKDIDNLNEGIKKISDIIEKSNKKLIVFIDELDRCEPEHILDLLASLKVIFNSNNDEEESDTGNKKEENNIIYFVAIDKNAVSQAIKTRYNDIIKAEEYLEKIFNISFNMPKHSTVKEFIMQYKFFNGDEIAEKLEKFFEAIDFKTPRHLKKVLNKYEILAEFKSSNVDSGLLPNIITKSNNDNEYLFDTIFILYFIILYEFYYEKYSEIKNYEDKLNNYVEHFKNIGRNDESHMDMDVNDKYIRNKKNMVKYYINHDLLNLQSIHLDYKLLSTIDNTKESIKYLLKILFSSENEEYIKFIENYMVLYPKIYELKKLYNLNNSNYNDIALPKTIEKFNNISPRLGNAINSGYVFDSLAYGLSCYKDDDIYFAKNILPYVINIKKEKNENVDRLLAKLEDDEPLKLYAYLSKLLFIYNKENIKKINEKISELLSELNKTDVEKLNNELLEKVYNSEDYSIYKKDLEKMASKLMKITTITYDLYELVPENNKKYEDTTWLFYRHNKYLLNLINIFTPIIKNKINYSIWDASLSKKKYTLKDNKNDPDKIILYCMKNDDLKTQKLESDDSYRSDIYDRSKSTIKDYIISNVTKYIEQFEYKNDEILIDFCKYLISEEFFEIIKEHSIDNYTNNDYTLKNLFDMAETLL
ncbi:KAP family P-loop NTPase fold protein [Methanococcus aeolicus]|uniref:KAP family P-loop NTPase fold protein n=1 Tax=Methanococcus aeolicus TaxID=42879 RepID=UPI0021CA11DB|nr:KAP family NTPase [Methanococcus aeolicus]UXM84275.1 KAP family NTPase [Methanococcus aeolicus]